MRGNLGVMAGRAGGMRASSPLPLFEGAGACFRHRMILVA